MEKKDTTERKKSSNVGNGIIFGALVGLLAALILDWNIAIGMGIGMSLGIVVAAITDMQRIRKNEQISDGD